MTGRRRPRVFLGATYYGWLARAWYAVGGIALFVLAALMIGALFASAWGPALAWFVIACITFAVWLTIAVAANL